VTGQVIELRTHAARYGFACLSAHERGAHVEALYWRPDLLARLADSLWTELGAFLAARESA
jgi:hypothetical protein